MKLRVVETLIQDKPAILGIDETIHFTTDEVVVKWRHGGARREDEEPKIEFVRMPKRLMTHLVTRGKRIETKEEDGAEV